MVKKSVRFKGSSGIVVAGLIALQSNVGLAVDAAVSPDLDLSTFYNEKYIQKLEMTPIPGASVIYLNPEIYREMFSGLPKSDVEVSLAERFGVQLRRAGDLAIDSTRTECSLPGVKCIPPYATQYLDEWGNKHAGDGRAATLAQVQGSVLNVKGIGVTRYAPSQATLWRNLNFEAKMGKARWKEAKKAIAGSMILSRSGIPGERVVAILTNPPAATKNDHLDPVSTELGDQSPILILRKVPGGSFRMGHLAIWDSKQSRKALEFLKRTYEIDFAKEVGSASDDEYLRFDAKASGRIAARVLHYRIVHGALSRSNIPLYPGLLDLDSLIQISVADPGYTSLAWYSRLGRTKQILRKFALERQGYFSALNSELSSVPVKELFDTAYDEERVLLLLNEMGYSSERILQSGLMQSEEFKDWAAQYFRMRSKYLKTDLECVVHEAANSWNQVVSSPEDWLKQLNQSKRCKVTQLEPSRFSVLQQMEHFIRNRNRKAGDSVLLPWLQNGIRLLSDAQGVIGRN